MPAFSFVLAQTVNLLNALQAIKQNENNVIICINVGAILFLF
jgi:hypothetical protein